MLWDYTTASALEHVAVSFSAKANSPRGPGQVRQGRTTGTWASVLCSVLATRRELAGATRAGWMLVPRRSDFDELHSGPHGHDPVQVMIRVMGY